ncbi:flagellin modification protein A [Sphingomonas sp. Leaf412]|uniref:oxidoreductase n=1 Tax=Sphingomonas sp. Leaf412 TaxID=1736370 RepID=UPI0006F70773|nr:oxidoreductase [Sphingomonas sp. Leaf412]KQT31156.1 flagellin modification protein A [Sphingomonas sp. Leaf412]
MTSVRPDLLTGRTIIVFGGAGRLGSAFCDDIAAAGGRPIVADRDRETAERVAAGIGDGATRAEAAEVDIADVASVDRVIGEIARRHGHVDGIVNSAYPRNARYGRRFEDVTYADFADNLSSHVAGMFLTCQRYHAHLVAAGRGGSIVNIASIYGVMAPRFEIYADTPMTMPVEYAAIKSGVIHLTRYMAKYFFGTGVRVNCVSPGGILAGQPEPFLESYRRFCADRGMLDSHDISGAINFLLSDASQFVNGQNLVVDDGFSL